MNTVSLLLLLAVMIGESVTVPIVRLPRIESSSINVQNSGKEYSYTIHENRGIGIEPIIAVQPALPHHQLPLLKIPNENNLNQEQIKPIEPQQSKSPAGQQQFQGIHLPAISAVSGYGYLPAYHHQYGITAYPYGLNYPYNLIATF